MRLKEQIEKDKERVRKHEKILRNGGIKEEERERKKEGQKEGGREGDRKRGREGGRERRGIQCLT